jgi:hypothetical protein
MAREKKLKAPVTLFAAIETEQHEALRKIAFDERRSLADVVREAIDRLIEARTQTRPVRARRAS